MATEPADPDPFLPQVVPPGPEIDPTAVLADDDEILDEGDFDTLTPDIDVPPPGRSWRFDFHGGGFLFGDQQGPLMTFGDDTLNGWIEKVMHTDLNAHVVHPAGYGMEGGPYSLIGTQIRAAPGDYEDKIRAALTFHPLIADIRNFAWSFDADDEWLEVTFTVVRRDAVTFPFSFTPTLFNG